MPFSSNSGKHLIDRAVQRISESSKAPLRVLDIGIGSGTYYDRYVNSWLTKPRTEWTGIEIWYPYIEKYALAGKYDDLRVTDARDFCRQNTHIGDGYFDICFVGDVAEQIGRAHV